MCVCIHVSVCVSVLLSLEKAPEPPPTLPQGWNTFCSLPNIVFFVGYFVPALFIRIWGPSAALHILGSGFVCQFSTRAKKTSIENTLPLWSVPLNGRAAHPEGHWSVSGELGHLPWLMHGVFAWMSVCVQQFRSVLTTVLPTSFFLICLQYLQN